MTHVTSGGRDDWETPLDLYEQLNQVYQFDYDAFASHSNALQGRYSTAEGTFMRSVHSNQPLQLDGRDGLAYPWDHLRVYMNPPYSRGFINKAVQKAVDERNAASVIVALLPAAVGTKWFQLLEEHAFLYLLPKRVRFINPDTGKPGASPPNGHVIAQFKREWKL